jgi:hypothetical protein
MIIVSAVVALSSTAIAQPFLEFTVTTHQAIQGTGDTGASTYAQFVVDASDPTQSVIPSTVIGFVTTPSNTLGRSPIEFTIDHFNTFSLPKGTFQISYSGSIPFQSVSIDLEFGSNENLFDNDLSIPDDPASYNNWFVGIMDAELTTGDYDGNWFEGLGFTTDHTFSISVREVPDPNPEPVCIADLNNDGNLNFLDISKYLELYGDGCP